LLLTESWRFIGGFSLDYSQYLFFPMLFYFVFDS
jgi:hypothetical protein